MDQQPILLWLRRDLRLGDLPPLLAAEGRRVLACFVLDPKLEASSGDRRLAFLFESLRDLHNQLDGRLLVVRGGGEDLYSSQDFFEDEEEFFGEDGPAPCHVTAKFRFHTNIPPIHGAYVVRPSSNAPSGLCVT